LIIVGDAIVLKIERTIKPMKNTISPKRIQNFVASSLAIAVFTTSSMVALATPERALMGELTVTGSAVTVNGERATSGRSISSSTVITTADDSSAVINLGTTGRIELAPNSSLSLNFDEKTISGSINEGNVKVSSAPGVEVKVATKEGEITNESSELNVFAVDAAGKAVTESGKLYMNNGRTVVQTGTQQTPDDEVSSAVPVGILIGAVAASVIYIVTRDEEDLQVVSPIR
jgi:hypothetical protein